MAGHRGERAADGAGTLAHRVTELLAEADPLGLVALGAPRDEYAPEARTIVPRLAAATSEADVATLVHEEFVRWFDPDIAGSRERYVDVAARLWALRAAVAPAGSGE